MLQYGTLGGRGSEIGCALRKNFLVGCKTAGARWQAGGKKFARFPTSIFMSSFEFVIRIGLRGAASSQEKTGRTF